MISFLKAFEEVGKDCPEFLSYLETRKAQFNDKAYKKELLAARKQFDKDKNEKLKQADKRERRKLEDKMDTDYYLKFYLDEIDAYSSRCQ